MRRLRPMVPGNLPWRAPKWPYSILEAAVTGRRFGLGTIAVLQELGSGEGGVWFPQCQADRGGRQLLLCAKAVFLARCRRPQRILRLAGEVVWGVPAKSSSYPSLQTFPSH